MRLRLSILFLIVLTGAAVSSQPLPPPAVPTGDARPSTTPGAPVGPGDVIVSLRVGGDSRSATYRADVRTVQESIRSALSPASAVKAQFVNLPALSLRAADADLRALASNPLVASITPDTRLQTTDYEASTLIAGELAYISGEGRDIRIAVIDSGIDMSHPSAALTSDVAGQYCFRTEGDCPPSGAQDQTGHGTHVAGIITGETGIAIHSKVIAYKVFTTGDTSDTNVLNALDHIITNAAVLGIDLVNMSLSGALYSTQAACDAANPAYVSAFAQLNAAGIAVFASTGNDFATFAVGAPACVTGAIGVGSVSDIYGAWCATDVRGLPSCFSNTTPVQGVGELVDLVAPGCAIESEFLGGGRAVLCGTSMASPMAAAVAALVLSSGYDPTPAELETLLEASGVPVYDGRTGQFYPMINFFYAFGGRVIPAPTNLQIDSESATHTTLSWTGAAGTGVQMERSANNGPFRPILGSLRDGSFTDSNLACGPLRYRVRIEAGTQTGSASDTVSRAAAVACPNPPTALDWTYAGADQFNLTWTDTAADETGFVVERSSDEGLTFTQAVVIDSPDLSNTVDSTPDGCGDYVYRVRAVRADMYASQSAPSAAAFAGCPPAGDPLGVPVSLGAWSGTRVESRVRYARRQTGDFAHVCRFSGPGPGNNTLYYTFTAPVDGYLTASTVGSTYDTILSILTGSPGSFASVACSEDVDPINFDFTSRIPFTPVQGGVTYTVYVSAWSNSALVQPNTLALSYEFRSSLFANGSFEDRIDGGKPAGWALVRSNPTAALAKCKAKPSFAHDGDCIVIFKPDPAVNRIKQTVPLDQWPASLVVLSAGDTVDLGLWTRGGAGSSRAVLKLIYGDETPKTKREVNLPTSTDFVWTTAAATVASKNLDAIKLVIKARGLTAKLKIDALSLWISPSARVPRVPPPSAPQDFRRGGA